MKKVTPEAIVFQPVIHAHHEASAAGLIHRYAISFDSNTPRDLKRESRTLWIQKDGVQQLDVRVEGFDRLSDPATDADGPSISGRILLVVTSQGGATNERVLAECALEPWAQHHSFKDGDRTKDVADAVRNGTVAAFTDMLPDLFSVSNHSVSKTERTAAERRGQVRSFGHRAKANRSLQRWRPWLAAGGVAVVLWVFLTIAGKPAQQPQSAQASVAATSPEMQALLQNQGLQPQAGADAQAQVELVKSTLKSMGLDPGASGDTGCLVHPH